MHLIWQMLAGQIRDTGTNALMVIRTSSQSAVELYSAAGVSSVVHPLEVQGTKSKLATVRAAL